MTPPNPQPEKLAVRRKGPESYFDEMDYYTTIDAIQKQPHLAHGTIQELKAQLTALEAENQKLREAHTDLTEQAISGINAERLAGNIVKEEFYKGQLSALRQLAALSNAGEGKEKE